MLPTHPTNTAAHPPSRTRPALKASAAFVMSTSSIPLRYAPTPAAAFLLWVFSGIVAPRAPAPAVLAPRPTTAAGSALPYLSRVFSASFCSCRQTPHRTQQKVGAEITNNHHHNTGGPKTLRGEASIIAEEYRGGVERRRGNAPGV